MPDKPPANYDILRGEDGKYRAIQISRSRRRTIDHPTDHRYQALALCREAALAKEATPPRGPGRPRLDTELVSRHPISLTEKHVKIAKAIGDGNISAGVRRALDIAEKASG